MIVARVIQESGQSRAQVARDAGLSEDALWSWLSGRRTPSDDSLRQLAEGLRRRADRLQELAGELEGAAE